GPDPQGSVRAGPGEDDADRPFLSVLCQRAKEKVDGHPDAIMFDSRDHGQNSPTDRQVLIRWYYVNAVGFNSHRILGLNNPHSRVPGKELRKQALVNWREVLDNDEGGPAICGHCGEESLEWLQSAGRSAH